MTSNSKFNRKQVRKYLSEKFSIEEIKVICFDLGVDYEEFSPKKSMLIIELLQYLSRANKVNSLASWLNEEGYSSNPLNLRIQDSEIDEERLEEMSSIISSIILGLESDRERDVINLLFYSDMSTKEVAEYLDLSELHIRIAKSRAMNRIKAKLKSYPEFSKHFDF